MASTILKNNDGEITINLVLTIKLDGSNLVIGTPEREFASRPKRKKKNKSEKTFKIEEDINLIIPDIESHNIIDFGNKVEE